MLADALAATPTPAAPPAVPRGVEVPEEAVKAAAAAGLRYISDAVPGIRRVARGRGFAYRGPDGRAVSDETTLARIRRLAIPPAWRDVWISPISSGHLQATGKDARGRKQYRYHPEWREVRDADKYERLAAFARALPRIRRTVDAHLALPGLPRERVLAAVVRLLETTFIRIGNQRYAKENGSYGLTTLRNRHVAVEGERIRFRFRGKSGKSHAVDLTDARLARLIRRCRELPGYELFQYVDAAGEPRTIESSDVNAYLKAITGEDYTAKDFRTWGGTLLAGLRLAVEEPASSRTHGARRVKAVISAVAAELGNTPAICRKCYVHPVIVDAYLRGGLARNGRVPRVSGLRAAEARVLAVLERAARSK